LHAQGIDVYDRLIDEEYERWLKIGLPTPLRKTAEQLPHRIGLSPDRRWRSWRRVFRTPVFRALPLLVAEGYPGVTRDQLRSLGLAHVLLIFSAFIDDRLNDGQVAFSRDLNLVRASMEAELLARLACSIGSHHDFWSLYRDAHRRYTDSHARESGYWTGRRAAYDDRRYSREAAGKIAIAGLPALALAILGRATSDQLDQLARAIEHCFIALQYADDAADWEEDFVAGRITYFVALHLEGLPENGSIKPRLAALRARVATSGITERFWTRAGRHYGRALGLLARFDVPTFGAWLEQERRALEAEAEARRGARAHARLSFAAQLDELGRRRAPRRNRPSTARAL
jgi:hypothetical protein